MPRYNVLVKERVTIAPVEQTDQAADSENTKKDLVFALRPMSGNVFTLFLTMLQHVVTHEKQGCSTQIYYARSHWG
jgi:hypothetical protein